MNGIFKTFLSLSLSGTLLILILLLCRPLFRNRISRRWQYNIWLVVVVRLLLPFTPEVSPVGILFQRIDRVTAQTDTAPKPVRQTGDLIGLDGDTSPDDVRAFPTAISPTLARMATVPQIIRLLWLITALMLFIRKITLYQGFVRYIRAGRTEVSKPELLNRLAEIGKQTGIKRPVELYVNSLVSSPLLLGFFKPCIILPCSNLPDPDFHYIIRHELTHYKRMDMFYKWLVQLTVCLHWFNPFIYLMEREINRNCELSCDEAIISKLAPNKQRAYGDTLIHALETGGNYRDSLASVTLNESKKLLKERLGAIMGYNQKSRLSTAATLALTLLFIMGAASIGAYAKPQDTAEPTVEISAVNTQAKQVIEGPVSANVNGPYLSVENCRIEYEDSAYKWPYIAIKRANTTDKIIESFDIAILAYEKDGKPLDLYWDARNVAKNGEVGSIGFHPDGTDYGIVTGIEPRSPKSYLWLLSYGSLDPGETSDDSSGGWTLFDGWWDQPNRIHKASYLLACIRQIKFEDGTIWNNPEYENWLTTYQEKQVSLETLISYY